MDGEKWIKILSLFWSLAESGKKKKVKQGKMNSNINHRKDDKHIQV